ncbi:hypothetical protein KAR91_65035 [Candidatus Pacearchaeota archaeon]|nr:hypothetical protein [Candidatus Pacearchaeota archaeon]
MNRDYFKVYVILLILATGIGCITAIDDSGQDGTTAIDRPVSQGDNGEPSPPVAVEFFFSEEPRLNTEVTLTLKVTSLDAVFEHVELGINLPQGIYLVSGKPTWEGTLKPRDPQSVSVNVKVVHEGRWKPEGTVFGYQNYSEGIYYGYNLHGTYPLYVYIKDDVVKVSNIPPPNNWNNKVGFSGSLNDKGLTSNISLSEPPLLDREVILSYVANTTVQLNNAQVSVVFPEKGMEMVTITSATIEQAGHVNKIDLELIEGTQQYNWRGFILEDSTIRAEMIVKSTLTGVGFVHATIRGNESIFQTVVLDIKVDEFSAFHNS